MKSNGISSFKAAISAYGRVILQLGQQQQMQATLQKPKKVEQVLLKQLLFQP